MHSENIKWFNKFGNISQMTSAVAAIVFGLSTFYLSWSVSSLQEIIARENDKSRDAAAIAKLEELILKDDDRMERGLTCQNVLVRYFESVPDWANSIDMSRLNGISRLFERRFLDEDDEESRIECLRDKHEPGYNLTYPLNALEMALSNWSPSISDERKSIYYKQLLPGICRGSIPEFIGLDDSKFSSRFTSGSPNLRRFSNQCNAYRLLNGTANAPRPSSPRPPQKP